MSLSQGARQALGERVGLRVLGKAARATPPGAQPLESPGWERGVRTRPRIPTPGPGRAPHSLPPGQGRAPNAPGSTARPVAPPPGR